ncbi:MAG: hypothetical protein OT478_13350 [Cyanobacteria bacterium FC1]|nr:hypothetical protein [Cyanobacteria bacterium FC1]
MSILAVDANFQRKYWLPLTQSGDTDGARGDINGFAVGNGTAAIFATVTQPNVATLSGEVNSTQLGGRDAYLAVWNA